jgi:rhodanese-related sulfurtransferase
MNNQVEFYKNKLQYEIDSSDLFYEVNNGEKIVVIDTRRPSFYEIEHIPNAINIPHRDMDAERVKNLDKEVLYVCYCDGIGCNASTKGALKLAEYGFNVKELLGGIEWWKRDGYNTEGTNVQQNSCGC